jgi:hypothetical protein
MNSTAKTAGITESSPTLKARIAGVFYLLVFVTGGLFMFASGRFVVSGDAAATATNILAHETSFRLGFASDLIMFVSYIAVTALFYDLFTAVNRSLSLLAAFFSLVGCAVGALSCVFLLAPLVVLRGGPSAFTPEQSQALAFLLLKFQAQTFNASLVFFSFYCLLIGSLILRSDFLPRTLGVLMTFAGLGWLTFLWPPLSKSLSPYVLIPGVLGEGSLTLWLLVKGVDAQRWEEQARRAGP